MYTADTKILGFHLQFIFSKVWLSVVITRCIFFNTCSLFLWVPSFLHILCQPAPSFQIDKLDLDGHKKYTRTNLFLPLSLACFFSIRRGVFFQHDDNHVLFAVKSITKRALQLLRAYILTARGIPVMSAHLKQKKMFKAYRRPKRHLLHTYTHSWTLRLF